MGGGNTTSTVTQSNLPEYAEPYFMSMMDRTLAESQSPYQTYTAQRLTGISDPTQTGLDMSTGFAASGTPGMATANTYATGAGQTGTNISTGQFGQAQADQYMSPYMNDVTNKAKTDAGMNWMREKQYRDSEAVKTGAFGGSRAAIAEGLSMSELQNRMTGIDVQGRQSAFENAQQQFNADRSAQLQGGQLANQSAGLLSDLQTSQDQMDLSRIKAQLGVGQATEDYQQQSLDMAYNDFVNQRDSERMNLQFLSSMLRGVPISANTDVATTTPSNPLAGILGSLGGLQALQRLGEQS